MQISGAPKHPTPEQLKTAQPQGERRPTWTLTAGFAYDLVRVAGGGALSALHRGGYRFHLCRWESCRPGRLTAHLLRTRGAFALVQGQLSDCNLKSLNTLYNVVLLTTRPCGAVRQVGRDTASQYCVSTWARSATTTSSAIRARDHPRQRKGQQAQAGRGGIPRRFVRDRGLVANENRLDFVRRVSYRYPTCPVSRARLA